MSRREDAKFRKNGNIRSFFGLVPKEASASEKLPPRIAAAIHTVSSPLSSTPPASPSPKSLRPTKVSRDIVIAESDEDDSDDSFPDIFAAPKPPPVTITAPPPSTAIPALPLPVTRQDDIFGTPRPRKRPARRKAAPPSPMAIRHPLFDMNELLKRSAKDEKTAARLELLNAAFEPDEEEKAQADESEEGSITAAIKQQVLGGITPTEGTSDQEGTGGPSRMRVAMAFERADLQDDEGKVFRFLGGPLLDDMQADVHFVKSGFPQKAARGVWAFLDNSKNRDAHMRSGLPYWIQTKRRNMPNEIFEWTLEEMCQEEDDQLRAAYCTLLGACPTQANQLMTSERVVKVFEAVGAMQVKDRQARLRVASSTSSKQYERPQVRILQTLLDLLAQVSPFLEFEVLLTAMEILVRMSFDQELSELCLATWQKTSGSIVRSVPTEVWDKFCRCVCDSLMASSDSPKMQWLALQYMTETSINPLRLLDLRTRLAAACFFHDAKYSLGEDIQATDIINRLESRDFTTGPKTDFAKLDALMCLLDVTISGIERPSTDPLLKDVASCKAFDQDIDYLAGTIKHMLSRVAMVGQGIQVLRIDAKNTLERVHGRLTREMRIKPPPTVDVLSFLSPSKAEASLWRQREKMHSFLHGPQTPTKKKAALAT